MSDQFSEDINLLLDSLNCRANDGRQQKQVLKALATILLQSAAAKNYFHYCGGLRFVLRLVSETKLWKVKVAGLYTLAIAVENHEKSKKEISKIEVFHQIKNFLQSQNQALVSSSAFLLMCLVTNNGEAQVLARQSRCISALCKLFETASAKSRNELCEEHLNETWDTVTAALSSLLVNPLNVENQLLCCGLLNTATNVVKNRVAGKLRRSAIVFLGACALRNVKVQTRLRCNGGLHALIRLFKDLSVSMATKTARKVDLQFVTDLLSTLCAILYDNEVNTRIASKLELTPTMVNFLKQQEWSSMAFKETVCSFFKKCFMTISNCIQLSEVSKKQFMEHHGVPVSVNVMARAQDDELKKIITFVLHLCVVPEDFDIFPNVHCETQRGSSGAAGDEGYCRTATWIAMGDADGKVKENTAALEDETEKGFVSVSVDLLKSHYDEKQIKDMQSLREADGVVRSKKLGSFDLSCPGCYNTPKTNSKTFGSLLLRSTNVCSRHRDMAKMLQLSYS